MLDVKNILDSFDSLGLEQIPEDAFNVRRDTKYLANINVLGTLLDALKDQWNILEVDGLRQHFYVSWYYDDAELTSFYDHLKERNNRQKFRLRKYQNEHAFFEIKTKNNKGITEKDRLKLTNDKLHNIPVDFVKENSPRDVEKLEENIEVQYKRITLYHKVNNEKITIDTSIHFKEDEQTKSYNNLLILELKQEAFDKNIETKNLLRDIGLRLNSCSKYCLGILNLREDVRHNRFKARLRILEKIEKEAV